MNPKTLSHYVHHLIIWKKFAFTISLVLSFRTLKADVGSLTYNSVSPEGHNSNQILKPGQSRNSGAWTGTYYRWSTHPSTSERFSVSPWRQAMHTRKVLSYIYVGSALREASELYEHLFWRFLGSCRWRGIELPYWSVLKRFKECYWEHAGFEQILSTTGQIELRKSSAYWEHLLSVLRSFTCNSNLYLIFYSSIPFLVRGYLYFFKEVSYSLWDYLVWLAVFIL